MAKGMILANDVFVWNAASHVGPGCQNALADVQLVQLGYAALAANPKSGAPPGRMVKPLVVPRFSVQSNPSSGPAQRSCPLAVA